MLKSRIAALGEEIARVQNQISTEGDGIRADAGGTGLRGADQPAGASSSRALASVVGRYQEVLLSQQFAEQAYAAAQASLERARGEADRTQSYLAVYVHPDVAEAAAYPQRLLNTLIVLVISAILWAIGALAALTIRDHMP
jgi:capsule polysaccharide export protein KpsE/RkpR